MGLKEAGENCCTYKNKMKNDECKDYTQTESALVAGAAKNQHPQLTCRNCILTILGRSTVFKHINCNHAPEKIQPRNI